MRWRLVFWNTLSESSRKEIDCLLYFHDVKTGSNNEKYSHLNQSMWVGSGIRSGNQGKIYNVSRRASETASN